MAEMLTYGRVAESLQDAGLRARGGFHATSADGLPSAVATVVLAGNVGGSLWDAFSADRRDEPDPLDGWSKRTLGRLAHELSHESSHGSSGERPGSVTAVFPSDGPPYYPFQQWAMRAEPVHPSPLGSLIHPDYGLWHAYRGALLFEAGLADVPAVSGVPSPCSTCVDRPCLRTCPAGAIDADEGGLDVAACIGHIREPAGDPCLAAACMARRACPVGAGYRYAEPQARFHMNAFLKARLAAG